MQRDLADDEQLAAASLAGLLLDETAARVWCESLASRLHVEHIRPDGRPYLDRFFVAGWNPITRQKGPAVFLHHFLASDPATHVHSHPWGWAVSLVLVGGYLERRCSADNAISVRTYRAGQVNVLMATDKHRIELLGPDSWTLFLAADFAQAWAFFPSC